MVVLVVLIRQSSAIMSHLRGGRWRQRGQSAVLRGLCQGTEMTQDPKELLSRKTISLVFMENPPVDQM